eukprot:1175436-Prorocentrum_minimum.AAC.1
MDDSRLWRFFNVREYSGGELNSPVVERLNKRARRTPTATLLRPFSGGPPPAAPLRSAGERPFAELVFGSQASYATQDPLCDGAVVLSCPMRLSDVALPSPMRLSRRHSAIR